MASGVVATLGWAAAKDTGLSTWADAGNMVCVNAEPGSVSSMLATQGPIGIVGPDGRGYSDAMEYARAWCELPTGSDAFLHSAGSAIATIGADLAAGGVVVAGTLLALRAIKKRVNVKRTLPASSVEPLRIAFEGAEHDGTKREVVRLLADDIFKDLKQRGVCGPQARATVAAIIDDKSGVAKDEAERAANLRSILRLMFTTEGDPQPLDKQNGNFVMTRLRTMSADDSAMLREQLRDVLFTPEGRYRGKAVRAVELELLDFLLGIDPQVARTEAR